MDRRIRILNRSEQRLVDLIRSEGREVFAKVRVADCLEIRDSGLSDEEFRYALMAHFDAVIVGSDGRAELAIEFDGPTHDDPERIRRDDMKDAIAHRLGLPLLRVQQHDLLRPRLWDDLPFRGSSEHLAVVRYLVDAFEAKRIFDEGAEAGWETEETKIEQPWKAVVMYLGAPAHAAIMDAWLRGDILSNGATIFLSPIGDLNRRFHEAIAVVALGRDRFLKGDARVSRFPGMAGVDLQLAEDLAVHAVARQLAGWQAGDERVVPFGIDELRILLLDTHDWMRLGAELPEGILKR